jgi:hypothetical protein
MDLSAAKEDYLRALELSPGNENIEKALLEIEEKFREGRDYQKLAYSPNWIVEQRLRILSASLSISGRPRPQRVCRVPAPAWRPS